MNNKKKSQFSKKAIDTALNYLDNGHLEHAAYLAQELYQQHPKNDQVLHLMGLVYVYQGDVEKGICLIQQAIRKKPLAQYFQNLGSSLQLTKKFSEAITCYQKALKLNKSLDTYLNLGFCYYNTEQYLKAIQFYQTYLKQCSNNPYAHYGLANSYFAQEQFDKAIQHYQLALQYDAHFVLAQLGLAELYLVTEQQTACLQQLFIAAKNSPHEVKIYQILAKLAFVLQKNTFDTSIALYLGLLFTDANPIFLETLEEIYTHKFIDALRTQELIKGWLYSRQRPIRKTLQSRCSKSFISNDIDIKNLANKTLLLYGEQGIGDHLFFLRYAPLLKQLYGCRLIVLTEPKLAPVLIQNPLFANVITQLDAAPSFDEVILIGDLPYLLSQHTLYPESLILSLNTIAQNKIQERLSILGSPPYLGLTWRGGTLVEDKSVISRLLYKEINLDQFAESLRPLTGHVTFLSLQRNASVEELERLSQLLGQTVHNLDDLNNDLEQMLALLAVIDEYVGVSNTNMHLMAGLARAAKVLVPYPADWRWSGHHENEIHWFQAFKVYRQTEEYSWHDALMQLQIDLEYLRI